VAFDVLVRHLSASGYQVTYVRNYTDVDDKIIARAKDRGLDWRDLGERYIRSFDEDMAALNCLPPTHSPRATEYIGQMLEDVLAIVGKGLAYPLDGDVYFDVAAFPAYGRLSGRELQDAEPGARVAVDSRKKNPADFALWKASKPGEPSWPSPWGQGRPGWHIECSAMSARLLGPAFDIHGGGQDLIFPHHENELAQSAALGRSMARIWAHNGFVNINNEKMSKSLGNFFTVKDILRKFSPDVLRFFLVSRHYRSPVEFSDEALRESGRAMERLCRAMILAGDLMAGHGPDSKPEARKGPEEREAREAAAAFGVRFREAMDDDLNTAQAVGVLFELVHRLNKAADEGQAILASALLTAVGAMAGQLGLSLEDPRAALSRLAGPLPAEGPPPEEIEAMVAARNAARARKDWAEADRLRLELSRMGIVLEDKAGQTAWRRQT
jgi:cysteinyl-tRNA synthetase